VSRLRQSRWDDIFFGIFTTMVNNQTLFNFMRSQHFKHDRPAGASCCNFMQARELEDDDVASNIENEDRRNLLGRLSQIVN
jgi:hypothetical protein